MGNRWTPLALKTFTEDEFRTEDVRRRSTGARYLIMAPFAAAPLLYWAIGWSAWIISVDLRSAVHRLALGLKGPSG